MVTDFAREVSATLRYWADRTIVVTGATRGIGAATALLFGAAGAHVVVNGRDAAAAESVATAIRSSGGIATIVLGDLSLAADCKHMIKQAVHATGHIDVLVNNAGANLFAGVLKTTLDEWDQCLNLDLRAAWLCAREAVPHMRAGSSIVNIISNHAAATLPGVFPYNVAKAGASALSQSLAIELAPRQIRVNSIAPGYIDTPINTAYFDTFSDAKAARRAVEALHPLGRLGTAVEIAYAIEFLADSKKSGFTTGTVLTIDGGRSALLQDPPPANDPRQHEEP